MSQPVTRRRAYIRPVHGGASGRELISFAVCRTNQPLLVDEQILDHFPADFSGKEIREWYENRYVLVWGKPLYSPTRELL